MNRRDFHVNRNATKRLAGRCEERAKIEFARDTFDPNWRKRKRDAELVSRVQAMQSARAHERSRPGRSD